MNMYKLKFTRLQNEIFRLLCIKAGASCNQREIAKILGVSPTAVSKSLSLLVKEDLIKIKKQGRINLLSIQLNRDNPMAINQKRIENLRMIYESGISEELASNFAGCAIFLFGSYSRGEDTLSSDIDIAVIGCKTKETDMSKFDRIMERKTTLNFYDSFGSIHKNLLDNILNGIILNGSVEL
ncbi:MAG: nucleotidyltransferase domain-containing protein [archaeon]